MTQKQDTVVGNELIARFMGLYYPDTKYPFGKPNAEVKYAEPHYHTSWDWLMPVVEKILRMDLSKVPFGRKQCITEILSAKNSHTISINYLLDISLMWNSCLQFITWYNNQ